MKNRPQRLFFFLVVWLTMFSCICGKAQNLLKINPWAIDFRHLPLLGTRPEFRTYGSARPVLEPVGNLSWQDLLAGSMNLQRPYSVPADIYYIQSGFFCKREWELEKASHIPFRFRVGSLADCNAMEGKN
jgi:hypothetical protein